jgi:uncharacterized metal-binding protein
MSESKASFSIEVESTTSVCPAGETAGNAMLAEGKMPVISCEGGCIRGEIARLAANMVAKEEPFARGCHGEIIAAPHSAIAKWARGAEKVVVIDGCFMHCHGRIMKNLIGEESLRIFDALSVHGKYCDLIEIDDVPEVERKETARQVAEKVLSELKQPLQKAP